MVQTGDGGYAIVGCTNSLGVGGYDWWLVKTDAAGNVQWNQAYGGANWEFARSVVQTGDGGYAIAGYTESFGAGNRDFWLVKTDSSGNMQWNNTYGGTSEDSVWSVVQTDDGGYALAGKTYSFGAGGKDFWLVKVASEVPVHDIAVTSVTPSPTEVTIGENVTITVVVKNKGTETETLAFTWDTTGVAAGNYTIKAVATLTGDTNTVNNELTADDTVTVKQPPDTTPPAISIVSPENKTYPVNDVPLTFTVSESTSWIGYSLDGQANMTITGNTTLSALSDGSHTLIVHGKDTAGNTGASERVYFSIETKKAEPFPTLIVAIIVTIAVVGAVVIVYFTKFKK